MGHCWDISLNYVIRHCGEFSVTAKLCLGQLCGDISVSETKETFNEDFTQPCTALVLIKLDLRIGEPMQNCIHKKENSPKPVNHRLTLKEGTKVKFVQIKIFPAHDFL